MQEAEVKKFMDEHQGFFTPADEELIYNSLLTVDDSLAKEAMSQNFKDPKKMKLISIFLGCLGVDRFLNGDYVMGFIKLVTMGLLFIGWLAGIFTIRPTTQSFNSAKLLVILYPGKIRKPTFISNFRKKWKEDPEWRAQMISSAKSLKGSFSDVQDTMYLH